MSPASFQMNSASTAITTASLSRLRDGLSWLCVSTPALVLIGYITLALHVRLDLGRWPLPVIENYVTPAFDTHSSLVSSLFYIAIFVPMPVWSLLLLLQRENISPRICWTQLACYVLGWALFILAAILDPTPFTEWLLD